MTWIIVKTVISALLIVAVSEAARRNPAAGALIAALPLVSVLGMIWLWAETRDVERLAAHSAATFWYVLPSLPLFLLLPALLRHGVGFPVALAAGLSLTLLFYLVMVWLLARWGIGL
jgi:hypothetical protein